MADTTARTLQLLELLQSAHLRTVAELADRLGVDDRTIRRDVARLGELGVPVETLRGRYGSYRLAAGQRVLPIMFRSEEVVPVFLGLFRAQAASRDPEIAAQTALAKIKRALPSAEAKRIDALLSAMTNTVQRGGVATDPAVMLTLAEAVNLHHVLDLRYLNGAGVASRRTIHPYGPVDDDLPDHDQTVMSAVFSRPVPDWTDRRAVAEHAAGNAASWGNDPEQSYKIAARIWDRTQTSEASVHQANQLGMVFSRIDCSPRWRERLGDLRIPSLIVHGRADPFFPVGNGELLAAEIPEAQLLIHENMGTQIPEWATDDIATSMLRL